MFNTKSLQEAGVCLNIYIFFTFIHVYKPYAYVFRGCRGQKRALDALELGLESQVIVSFLMWMLASVLSSLEGATSVLNS